METDLHSANLIDRFIRGEMDGAEKASFEKNMAENPDLKSKVDFQQAIAKGLGDFRKAQLKSRLDALEVGTGWQPGVGSLSHGGAKLVGGVLSAVIIGAGIYMWNQPSEEQFAPEKNRLDLAQGEKQPVMDMVPPVPVVRLAERDKEMKLEEAENVAQKSVGDLSEDAQRADLNHGVISQKVNNSPHNRTEGDYVPSATKPSFDGFKDAEEFLTQEAISPMEGGAVEEIKAESIEVKTINKRSETLKYRYFDGKLYLYGDFKSEPYEILEINSSTERRVYLYYLKKYYALKTTGNVKSLSPIENPKLIKELAIVRANKAQ